MKTFLSIALATSLHAGEWKKTILRSETAKVTIVPEIGRIMQFGFIGEPGVFWNAPELLDQPADPARTTWQNFGGEKVWTAPEKDWAHFSSREGWLPPAGFDATPATLSETTATSTTMTWPEDEKTGIRMTRKISLEDSTLTVTTVWKRFKPGSAPLSIWTIAQLKHPELMIIGKAPADRLPQGVIQLSKEMPPSLKEEAETYTLTRDAETAYKIGTAGDFLCWVGTDSTLTVNTWADAFLDENSVQPDAGSRIQIYTSSDAKPYVEFETLAPLQNLPVGRETSHSVTYVLAKR